MCKRFLLLCCWASQRRIRWSEHLATLTCSRLRVCEVLASEYFILTWLWIIFYYEEIANTWCSKQIAPISVETRYFPQGVQQYSRGEIRTDEWFSLVFQTEGISVKLFENDSYHSDISWAYITMAPTPADQNYPYQNDTYQN